MTEHSLQCVAHFGVIEIWCYMLPAVIVGSRVTRRAPCASFTLSFLCCRGVCVAYRYSGVASCADNLHGFQASHWNCFYFYSNFQFYLVASCIVACTGKCEENNPERAQLGNLPNVLEIIEKGNLVAVAGGCSSQGRGLHDEQLIDIRAGRCYGFGCYLPKW